MLVGHVFDWPQGAPGGLRALDIAPVGPVDGQNRPVVEQLRIAIVPWPERTYHLHRRQHRPGRSTSVKFEVIMSTRAVLTV